MIETPSLVCSLDLALTLADQKMRGHFDLPGPTAALVVLTTVSDCPIQDHHRDLLWSAFGLPTFEQLRAVGGKVIARECEVHDGLHIVDTAEVPERAEIIDAECDCGNRMPRIRAISQPPLRRSAVA